MKDIMRASFWIFELAIVLNSFELSLQSDTPRLKAVRPDGQGGIIKGEIVNYPGASPPLRKVRCPPLDERHMDTTYFVMQDRSGKYIDCTEDIILLARGPLIIGFNRGGEICPIYSFFGHAIVYNEKKNKQYLAGKEYLRLLGVFGRVPPEVERQREIHPFGLFKKKRDKSSRKSNSEDDSGSDLDFHSGSEFDLEPSSTSPSTSPSSSRSSSRSSSHSSSRSSKHSSSRGIPPIAPAAPE